MQDHRKCRKGCLGIENLGLVETLNFSCAETNVNELKLAHFQAHEKFNV